MKVKYSNPIASFVNSCSDMKTSEKCINQPLLSQLVLSLVQIYSFIWALYFIEFVILMYFCTKKKLLLIININSKSKCNFNNYMLLLTFSY